MQYRTKASGVSMTLSSKHLHDAKRNSTQHHHFEHFRALTDVSVVRCHLWALIVGGLHRPTIGAWKSHVFATNQKIEIFLITGNLFFLKQFCLFDVHSLVADQYRCKKKKII